MQVPCGLQASPPPSPSPSPSTPPPTLCIPLPSPRPAHNTLVSRGAATIRLPFHYFVISVQWRPGRSINPVSSLHPLCRLFVRKKKKSNPEKEKKKENSFFSPNRVCLSIMQRDFFFVFLFFLFPHKNDAHCSAWHWPITTPRPITISFSFALTFDIPTEAQLFCKAESLQCRRDRILLAAVSRDTFGCLFLFIHSFFLCKSSAETR